MTTLIGIIVIILAVAAGAAFAFNGLVRRRNRTKEAWKKTIAKMVDRGAEGTDEQFDAIIAYLAKNFGRVNVNKATADEIVSGIDFSSKEAEAIVAYREKNGPYKEWKDLAKVEGLDAAKVDAKKNHIAVQ